MESQKGLWPLFIRGATRCVFNYDIVTTTIQIVMNIARLPTIRTLSLRDLLEVEEDKNEEKREEEEEMKIRLPAAPSLYLANQLENEKVDLPS